MSLDVFRGDRAAHDAQDRKQMRQKHLLRRPLAAVALSTLSIACFWMVVAPNGSTTRGLAWLDDILVDEAHASEQPGLRTSSLTYEDPDRDGLPSTLEFLIGTDPQKFDTDDDGFDDGLELTIQSNPLFQDEMIDGQSAVRIHFFPVPDNQLGILVTAFGHQGFQAFERFRILSGRGTTYEDRTRKFHDHGFRLESDNHLIVSLAISLPLENVGRRVNVIAEFLEFGQLRSDTKAFGHFDGDIFIQRFHEDHEGFLHGRYNVLGKRPYTLVPGIGFEWGVMPQTRGGGTGGGTDYLSDHIFTEKIMRYRSRGVIIDTVVENRCDEEPDEQCPLSLDTVGEVRFGPAR